MQALKKLAALKKNYDEEIRRVGEDALKETLKAFFDRFPAVIEVNWRQYTPHFNDGEPCVFRMQGMYIKLAGEIYEDEDYKSGLDSFELNYGEREGKYTELYSAFKELEEELSSGPGLDIVETLGDHSKVIATPGKITVEEYEHD